MGLFLKPYYIKKKKDILYEKEMGDFAEIIPEPLSML